MHNRPFFLGEKRLEGLVSRDLNIYPNELQDSLSDYCHVIAECNAMSSSDLTESDD